VRQWPRDIRRMRQGAQRAAREAGTQCAVLSSADGVSVVDRCPASRRADRRRPARRARHGRRRGASARPAVRRRDRRDRRGVACSRARRRRYAVSADRPRRAGQGARPRLAAGRSVPACGVCRRAPPAHRLRGGGRPRCKQDRALERDPRGSAEHPRRGMDARPTGDDRRSGMARGDAETRLRRVRQAVLRAVLRRVFRRSGRGGPPPVEGRLLRCVAGP